MKKTLLLIIAPFAFLSALFAFITQKEADEIVLERMLRETQPYLVYAKENLQGDGMKLTTSSGEAIELDYSCWVYYIRYTGQGDNNAGRYLIVKEDNGNLLEINAKNDIGPEDLAEWRNLQPSHLCHCIMDTLQGEWSWYKTYGWPIISQDNEFKSIVKFLSQNEDTSINYEVIVEDTVFYKGSFQMTANSSRDLKLPHNKFGPVSTWVLFFGEARIGGMPGKDTITFKEGRTEGLSYFYQKIRKG